MIFGAYLLLRFSRSESGQKAVKPLTKHIMHLSPAHQSCSTQRGSPVGPLNGT